MSHADAVRSYWEAADKRDWDAFEALLADDVVYRIPQTGEQITGKRHYVRFNIEYPGDWRIGVERVIAEGSEAASWISSTVGSDSQGAVTFFRFDAAGLICDVTDFWPEPYDRPDRPEGVLDVP
ncbi:MAG: nuclear transport factor 2 family protein [Nocardioidaceae bacterium]